MGKYVDGFFKWINSTTPVADSFIFISFFVFSSPPLKNSLPNKRSGGDGDDRALQDIWTSLCIATSRT